VSVGDQAGRLGEHLGARPGRCPPVSLHPVLRGGREIDDGVDPPGRDAEGEALLNRGCQTLQASLTSLQSAVAGPGGYTYTRSASLVDLIEQRLAAPGRDSGDGHLALRDLRLIDGALAELAGALGLHVTSYDIGPADDHIRSAGTPDPAGEPASSQSAAADGGEPDR
jgi:hypothetical protein